MTMMTANKYLAGESKTFLDNSTMNVSNFFGRRKPSGAITSGGISLIDKTTVIDIDRNVDGSTMNDKEYL
jgi:hypothetical protein